MLFVQFSFFASRNPALSLDMISVLFRVANLESGFLISCLESPCISLLLIPSFLIELLSSRGSYHLGNYKIVRLLFRVNCF